MAAKQNGRIQTCLDDTWRSSAPRQAKKDLKDWNPTFEQLGDLAKTLKGGKGQHAINTPVFSLIKNAVELGRIATSDPYAINQLWDSFKKVERALKKVKTTLHRSSR